jgi:catechol 2,3-dioxygenase-like lactoylglutathione lyase family enzyme
MTENFDAFEISPVPVPGPGATAPGVYRGIYGMPMFVTVPTSDLAASVAFWTEGLGFVDLFTIPGQLTHVRRWAFQDALLVPTGRPAQAPAVTVSFACVLDELEGIAQACADLLPGCTTGPRSTPWNTVDLEVTTPENARVVMTAARELGLTGPEAQYLEAAGFDIPRPLPD